MGKKVTTADFIRKSRAIHGDKYGYNKSVYLKAKTPVVIYCPIHGDFTQAPDQHTHGFGCQLCGGSTRGDTNSFVLKAKKVHGGRYDYSLVEYKNSHSKVFIFCVEHDYLFSQAPTHHLSGKGCTKCAKKHRPNNAEFISKLKEVHGDVFDFSQTIYGKDNTVKVTLFCKKHQRSFTKSPANLLKGQGCPMCAKTGFKADAPAILYYLELDGGLFKLGVTNNTIHIRYNKKDKIRILRSYTWHYEFGYDAYVIEQFLLSFYKDDLYKGPPALTSGNTEIFTKDVLGVFHD